MTHMDDDEFTELVDADIPRVDLVDKAANGLRFIIAKQADGSAGLMDPALVRELIGKSEPAPEPEKETVTMTGSPGALMKLIHEAAVRKSAGPGEHATVSVDLRGSQVMSEEDVDRLAEGVGGQMSKAELSTKKINDLPDSAFAYVEAGGKKDDEGKTTPRSLRHFPIHDAAHVRNALSRAPQSPFGDKAMPKIRAAAKKFGIEVSKMVGGEPDEGVDGMDPTVVLAAPEEDDAPGDPNDPGSPAWEAIDAATARKWTSILSRAKNALGVLADREALEAATADPSDAENAMDLDDAACAIDYAISVLAPFAVDEQAEADCCDDMQAVGKALDAFDPAPLDTIEAFSHVAKAGRVLSSANEAAIRGAVESLQKVLASLPQAPAAPDESGQSVAKEESTMADTEAATAETPDETVTKADGEKAPMVAVYDAKGKLVGIVDPTEITPISGAESDDAPDSDASDDASDSSDDSAAEAAPDPSDLTPAPADEVGTPADAAASDDDHVTKTEPTDETETDDTTSDAVLKSSILDVVKATLDEHSATQNEQIAKTRDAVLEMADIVETLKGRIEALEEQPAEPKVFTNGAVPPPQLRGQDRGAKQVDVTKARELKQTLYNGTAAEQNKAHLDMQTLAIAQLQEIHQRRAQ